MDLQVSLGKCKCIAHRAGLYNLYLFICLIRDVTSPLNLDEQKI